jgi:pantetheine-phosphate adenylyltransferase
MSKGIYAGTFDPITLGHLRIIKRSLSVCSHLVVAIGINPDKKTAFTEEQRIEMMKAALPLGVQVSSFQGLLVEYAKEIGANILIRGIRSVSDFEYEIGLANINKVLAPEIETIFLPTSPDLAVVSSSAAKEIARHGGDISKFVPRYVERCIQSKLGFVKTGAAPVCDECGTMMKLTDDKPSFYYCRCCGRMGPFQK